MAHIALIYPPLAQPFSPSLAIAELASIVKEAGHTTKVFDLNVRTHVDLLSPLSIEKILSKINNQIARIETQKVLKGKDLLLYSEIISAASYGSKVIERIEESISALKQLDNYCYKENGEEVLKEHWAIYEAAHDLVFNAMDRFPFDNASCYMNEEAILNAIQDPTTTPYADLFESYSIEIAQNNPNVIGINITFPEQIIPAFLLVNYLKLKTNSLICIGGSIPILLADELKRCPKLFKYVDGIGIGDGEPSILALANGKDLQFVPNLLILNKNEEVTNTKKEFWNIQDSPTPYFDDESLSLLFVPQPIIPYQTVKSCYYGQCKFCNYNVIHPHLNERTVGRIVDDLELLTKKHNTDLISVADDATSPHRLLAISEEIIRRELQIFWWTCTRFDDNWNKRMIDVLENAGCARLFFGLESAVPRIQKNLAGKGFKSDKAKNVLKILEKTKIHPHLSAIIGFPTETVDEGMKTIEFMKEASKIHGVTTRIHLFRLVKDSLFTKAINHNLGIDEIKRSEVNALAVEFDHFSTTSGMNGREAEKLIGEFYKYKEELPKHYYDENHTFEPLIWAKQNNRAKLIPLTSTKFYNNFTTPKLIPNVSIRKVAFSPEEVIKSADLIIDCTLNILYSGKISSWKKALYEVLNSIPPLYQSEGLLICDVVSGNVLLVSHIKFLPFLRMFDGNHSLIFIRENFIKNGTGNLDEINQLVGELSLKRFLK